jgi:uncharacterized protein
MPNRELLLNHLANAKAIYTCFSTGDIPGLLEIISDTVEWEYGASPSMIPWLQPRHGKSGAAEFFAVLGRSMQVHALSPTAFFQSGNTVLVTIDIEFTVLATGKRVREIDEVHIWHFNDEGRVQRFRHRADTLMHERACS